MIRAIAILLLAGCAAPIGGATSPAPACRSFSQLVPEAQLFSYQSGNKPVTIDAPAPFVFVAIGATNELNTSPASIDGHFLEPKASGSWAFGGSSFTVQQTLANYDNGKGILATGELCAAIEKGVIGV